MKENIHIQENCLYVSIPEAECKYRHYCMWLDVTETENKYGLSYDVNCWSSPQKDKCYKTLLENEWDRLNVLKVEPFGNKNIIVAESHGKVCAFYLSCNYDYAMDRIEINIDQLCPCIYDKIGYGFECEDILFLYSDGLVAFYDLDNNYYSDDYNKICESEKCNTVLLLYDKDEIYVYSLNKGILPEAYTYVSCIDNNFVECYNKSGSKIINVCGEAPFPEKIFEYQNIEYQCNYKEGAVYRVTKNCTLDGEPWWMSYLVFYSKKSDRFYVTESFEQIKVYAIAPEHRIIYISGIELLKDGIWSAYHGESIVGCDEGIKKLSILKKQNL